MPQKDIEKLLAAMEDKVWVTVESTVQPSQYEPIKISMGQSRTVSSDENPDQVRMEIFRRLLKDVISESEKARYCRAKEYFNEDELQKDSPTEQQSSQPIRRRRPI